MNNATQPSDGKSQSAEESKKAIWSWEKAKKFFLWIKEKSIIFFSWFKNRPLLIKEYVLCPATCFLNLFFVASLTLGLVYGYYAMYDNSATEIDDNRIGVKLCIDNKEIPQEQESKIQCCNGSGISCNGNSISCNGNGITDGLRKVVKKTTQATIILMVVVFIFLSLEVYCRCKNKETEENNEDGRNIPGSQKEDRTKERRDKLIKALTATLGISAIPTGISLIICAFYGMEWMRLLTGVEAYIAFAGISIISIAFLSVFHEEEGMNDGTNPEDTQK